VLNDLQKISLMCAQGIYAIDVYIKEDLRGLELTIGASQKSWCWLFAQLLLLKFG
jgi:hypothetical protein